MAAGEDKFDAPTTGGTFPRQPHDAVSYRARRLNRRLAPPTDWKVTGRDFLQAARSPLILARDLARYFIRDVAPGNLLCVPIEKCTNTFAFSYGEPLGWHYYGDLVKQLIEQPGVRLEDTRFHHFFGQISAPRMTDLMSFHDSELRASLPDLPYGSYPWGAWGRLSRTPPQHFLDIARDRGSTAFMWYEKGPETMDLLGQQFRKLHQLLDTFREGGYRIVLSRFRHPLVTMLVSNTGDVRFVELDGQHRLAVLSACGQKHVWVRLCPKRFPAIFEDRIESWAYVRSGMIRADQARRWFRLYFHLNGAERARALGVEVR